MEIKEIIRQLESADSGHQQKEYCLTDEAIEGAVKYLKKEIPQPLESYKKYGVGKCPVCKCDICLDKGEKCYCPDCGQLVEVKP
jgi:hypothetical protein